MKRLILLLLSLLPLVSAAATNNYNILDTTTITGGSLVNGTLSGTTTLSSMSPSRLLITNGSRILTTYTGTSCTNQFSRSISAAGLATCESVANADLAGSIAASKLIGTDIATLGTVTAGVWQATPVAAQYGGTGTNFAAGSGILLFTSGTATLLSSTGTGNVVRATSPTLVAPVLGAATATTINGVAFTTSSGTLTLGSGKTLTIANTLTFAGTDGSTLNVGTGGTLGTAAYTAASAYAPATSGSTLLLGNGSGGTSNYAGSSPAACSNQFPRATALSTVGALSFTCATVGSSDLASSLTLTTPNIGAATATTINASGQIQSAGAYISDFVAAGLAGDFTIKRSGTARGYIGTDASSVFSLLDSTAVARLKVSTTGVDINGILSSAAGVTSARFVATGGTSPSMGACGTSPSVAGNDSAMRVTVGTGGAATSCAVTFSTSWSTAPVCVAQNDTDRVAYSMVTTTSTLTITATAAFTASSKFHILCTGI